MYLLYFAYKKNASESQEIFVKTHCDNFPAKDGYILIFTSIVNKWLAWPISYQNVVKMDIQDIKYWFHEEALPCKTRHSYIFFTSLVSLAPAALHKNWPLLAILFLTTSLRKHICNYGNIEKWTDEWNLFEIEK